MSIANVRAALEMRLASLTPAMPIAWENVDFAPTAGVPYAAAYLLPASPDNAEIGPAYTEQGLFQVSLFYPKGDGASAAQARAEVIRDAYPVGASLTANGVVVNIIATPEIGPARPEDDRFFVPVKIRFQARIGG